MSGETGAVESGWTVDTLHLYLQRQIDDLRALLDERAVSSEKATTTAMAAAEKRLEGVNEFRAQLTDQAATFVTHTEIDTKIAAMAERIAELRARVDKNEGTSTGTAKATDNTRQVVAIVLSVALSAAAIIVAVVLAL